VAYFCNLTTSTHLFCIQPNTCSACKHLVWKTPYERKVCWISVFQERSNYAHQRDNIELQPKQPTTYSSLLAYGHSPRSSEVQRQSVGEALSLRLNLFCRNGASAFWAALRFTSSSDSGMTRSDRIRLTMPNKTAAQNAQAAATECIS